MKPKILVVFFIGFMINGSYLEAKPALEINPSVTTAEKGHDFQIPVKISAEKSMKDISVVVTEPEGFCVKALAMPGIDVEKNIVNISKLSAGSEITLLFKVQPPDILGNPSCEGREKETLYSTREPKTFLVNLFYKREGKPGQEGRVTGKLSLTYTTTIGHYLVSGIVGLILGFVVKMGAQYKDEIGKAVSDQQSIVDKLRALRNQLFVSRIPLLLTVLIVGFGVLLSLAHESLPVSSWHQAVGLGIGIGVLSDEKLISKIKGGA